MNFNKKKKILLTLLMCCAIVSAGFLTGSAAQAATNIAPTRIDMSSPLNIRDGGAIIQNFNEENINVRKVLRYLARWGNTNVILDESVQGDISLALSGVTVEKAFEYVRKLANLSYTYKGDNVILVSAQNTAVEKGLNRTLSKFIPVRFVNARLVAGLLNNTVFQSNSQDASQTVAQKATAEFRTNSVIIVGTENDIRMAQEFISSIDFPRESKVYQINHANALEIAQLLEASVFNDGISPFDAGQSEAMGDINLTPSKVSVITETYEEGQGSGEVMGASGGAGGGGTQQTFTLRRKTVQSEEVQIAPNGPIVVPDSRTNTLTVLGTRAQIELVDCILPTLDQKLPQVAIETSLIEIFEEGLREFEATIGTADGQFALGFNNSTARSPITAGEVAIPTNDPVIIEEFVTQIDPATGQTTITTQADPLRSRISPGRPFNIIGLPTVRDRGQEGTQFAWTTAPIDRSSQVLAQLNAILANRKGKLLANPTVVALHNAESVISITEEIVRRSTVTRDSTGFTQTQIEIGEAGIVLNILPKISGDGYVSLRIRPSVSSIAGEVATLQGTTTLLKRRDLAVQEVRLANGQTLALGGLLQETENDLGSKIPILGDLPIIGALFRTNYKDMGRTELVMLVTPRILEDSRPVSSSLSKIMRKPEFRQMLNKTTQD